MVLTDQTLKGYINNETSSDSGFICVACKPGYKASFDSFKKINSCVEISNCNALSYAGCLECEDSYSFGFMIDYLRTDYRECIDSSSIPYCYSGV